MTYEQKEGSGSLFRTHNKQTIKHPDYFGELRADKDIKKGELIKLSAWDTVSKNGNEFISLAVNNFKKEESDADYLKSEKLDKEMPYRGSGTNDLPDDDVPF